MISADFKGKCVLVTGAVSGIGLATARIFSDNGATVAVNHLPDDPSAETVIEALRANGSDVVSAPGDVSIPGEAENMVTTAAAALGRLDVLVNNAGIPGAGIKLEDMAAEHLKKTHGAIVNTASIAGLGVPGSSIAYGASKAGVINLTRNLAHALAPDVRVNAIAPGLVRTPWTEPWPEARKKSGIANSLLQRMVEPEDIAQTMLFLASNTAITGQTVAVDCGRQG